MTKKINDVSIQIGEAINSEFRQNKITTPQESQSENNASIKVEKAVNSFFGGGSIVEFNTENGGSNEFGSAAEAAMQVHKLLYSARKFYEEKGVDISDDLIVKKSVNFTRSHPSFKKRLFAAGKAFTFEAIEQACDHPLVSPFVKALQAGIDPE